MPAPIWSCRTMLLLPRNHDVPLIAEQSSEDRPLVICLLNAPRNLYFGATHQKHIIENVFLIQTHSMLARKPEAHHREYFPNPNHRIEPNQILTFSRQLAHAVIWRFHGKFDDFTAIWQFHGNWPMLWFDSFMGGGPSCNFTISWQMAHAAIWWFHARGSMM